MSEEITRWRKKPVEVEAVRWTGDNADAVFELAGCGYFDVLDEQQRRDCDDPEATAAVFDKLHSTWVLVFDGQWIIRGVKGEFYPCADDVFRGTYEDAGTAAPDYRALLDKSTAAHWNVGLPGEQAIANAHRREAGLEELT
jgi:hypothetical protein